MSTTYPDWQNYAQWVGTPIVNDPGRVLNAGTHSFGSFDVSGWRGVLVSLSVGNGVGAQVDVVYRLGGGIGTTSSSQALVALVNQSGYLTIDSPANTISDISVTGGGAGTITNLVVAPCNLDRQLFAAINNGRLLHLSAVPIAGPGVNTHLLPPYKGQVQLQVTSAAGNLSLLVDAMRSDAVTIDARLFDAAAALRNRVNQLPLLGFPTRVTVTNAGAATTYDIDAVIDT